jgi:DNA-binding transcriptional regulator YdaS (Cro superfamily)
MNAINQAIAIIGGQTELAKQLGTSVQAVNNWTRRGSVPPEYAPVIEVLTGRKIKADAMCAQVPWRLVRGTEAA